MALIGIDIGSTSAKAIVLEEGGGLLFKCIRPTGWSSGEAAEALRGALKAAGYAPEEISCAATGYGRLNVPFAAKAVTEITCHAKGAAYLFGSGELTVIDIGGQDTKIIRVSSGRVADFVMNDKCSAGTGRFLEVMANSLSVGPGDLIELARRGKPIPISALCTVFAESEVISLVGRGTPKEDIARGIVASIAEKVASQSAKLGTGEAYFLTGGLCACPFILEALSEKLGAPVETHPLARYAGALGAALIAADPGK